MGGAGLAAAQEAQMPSADIFVHGNLGQQKIGNTIVIQCDVFNTGPVAHFFPVSVKLMNAADNIVLPFQSIYLKPGQFGTLTFNYALKPDSTSLGLYAVEGSVWQVQGPKKRLSLKTDTQIFEVVLGEVMKSVVLENLTLKGKVVGGSTVSLKCLVRNTGKVSYTFPVSVNLSGSDGPFIAPVKTVTLGPKKNQGLSFDVKIPAEGIEPNAVLRVVAWDRKDEKGKLLMPYADAVISLETASQTSVEASFDGEIGDQPRGKTFTIACKIKNNGGTRFEFPVKLDILDSSDELVATPKPKKVLLKPGETKRIGFSTAIKEVGAYQAVVSVWKERRGPDSFVDKLTEEEQNFSIANEATGGAEQQGMDLGVGETPSVAPPAVKLMDIMLATSQDQKTPVKAQVSDKLGAVSCRLYYRLSTETNPDFVEMNLFSGDAKSGVWVGEVDLSRLSGKIIFYAEAANTESVLGRSKEYSIAKMATPKNKPNK